MDVGLYDVDSHRFPNLCLMKISAYHKAKGDNVEWWFPLKHYDIVYVSKIFGDEYTAMDLTAINADKVVFGGTGFAIKVEDGKEVYHKSLDGELPAEIEHIYPDYGLYPELTKDKAYGFLTRGCPNSCPFCPVSQKEGRKSVKVADLDEFWRGQKNLMLLDPNLLACKDHMDLLKQIIDSKAKVDFHQGLDARFINEDNAQMLSKINISMVHFAFDLMKFEKPILKGLELAKKYLNVADRNTVVYILTNFNTTIQEDLYRIKRVQELGYLPDVRIYRKTSLPKRHILRDLQRWCNNRFLYQSCKFFDFVPRSDGKKIKDIYENELKGCDYI